MKPLGVRYLPISRVVRYPSLTLRFERWKSMTSFFQCPESLNKILIHQIILLCVLELSLEGQKDVLFYRKNS